MTILSNAAWYAQSEYLVRLIKKDFRGEISEEEKKVLDAWLDSSVENRSWYESLSDEDKLTEILTSFNAVDPDAACDRLLAKLDAQKPTARKIRPDWKLVVVQAKRIRTFWRVAAAVIIVVAATIIVIAIGLNIYAPLSENNRSSIPETAKADTVAVPPVLAANDQIMLTLEDGSMVQPEKVDGTVIRQGDVEVSLKNGRIVYKQIASNSNGPVTYNVLTIPRGKQCVLELADGSIIQLNTLSSIRYPVRFIGNERRVEITGEAYFEVESNAARKFIVVNDGTEIQARGTKFNVKAYGDDVKITTTLIEGELNLVSGDKERILKSRQTAVITPEKSIEVFDLTRERTEDDRAWTQGALIFTNADAVTVMKHVERLYDVQVIYQDTPAVKLVGRFKQKDPIDTLLLNLNERRLWNIRRGNIITVYGQPQVNTTE